MPSAFELRPQAAKSLRRLPRPDRERIPCATLDSVIGSLHGRMTGAGGRADTTVMGPLVRLL
jgi:uncharacterized protein YcfJ